MRTVIGVVVAAALGLALAAPAHALNVGDKAPDFALNGPDGKPVKLADLTAKGRSSIRSSPRSTAPERRKWRASTRRCRSSKPPAPRSWA